MTVSTKEEAFHRVSAALERAKDQILCGIPERDHVDAMCGVIELIEEHNEEHVKYILGKMCLEMTQLSASLKAIQGESELKQVLQQILPDRVKRLAIAEHDLLQLQIQLDEVQKENTMIKRTNTQLTENLEDAKTRLAEIQLRMESSRATDSSIMLGDETAALKEKIEALEVELEELKNINEFNDDMLHHKEVDIEELDQQCEGLTQMNSQLMTRLEIMNREMNELKITSEEFDVKSEAGSASTGSGDRAGFTSVPGPESAALGITASVPRGADNKPTDKSDKTHRP
jgi:DNA repair exonuclease SbcCD ATPase subunit